MAESQTKQCQNCKQDFTIEPDDFAFYGKIKVPPPTWCPECRFQRRMAFRNERKLFRVKSAKSGKDILALVPANSGLTVYEEDEWWADDWDPMTYGFDYDFSKPFFMQFFELVRKVPRASRMATNMVNSEYSANAAYLKNCYLMFNSNRDEDCAYGNGVDWSRDCLDNSHINKCERCYESFWLTGCYQNYFSSQCESCNNVWFSKNCRGCSDCFGCVNIRDKKYHLFNEVRSHEEYLQEIEKMKLNTWSGLAGAKRKAKEFWNRFPSKFMQGIKNAGVTGEYVTHSKNVRHGYLVREGENLKYVQYLQVPPNKDCYDISIWGDNNQMCYENMVCGLGAYNSRFCYECWPEVKDLEYCMFCNSSSNLFGCVGLRKKEFCIFNKQDTKEEYGKMRAYIVEQMNRMPYKDKGGRTYVYGEFFPIEFSPYGYNNATVNEHFPLSKEEVEKEGWLWLEVERKAYETTMRADEIPDSIDDINDGILKETIQCAACRRAYRLIPQELAFLRRERLPAPRTCVDCRHGDRVAQRQKSKLYHRRCMCNYEVYKNSTAHNHHPTSPCPNEFETSYAPDRKEIIYCEQCYNAEVI